MWKVDEMPSSAAWSSLEDVSKETVKEDYVEHVMKIFVLRGSAAHERPTPAHVSIIEGTEVLDDCKCVAKAYLCNELKLPTKDEVFQKLFLELDVLNMSPKVQSLLNKLLA